MTSQNDGNDEVKEAPEGMTAENIEVFEKVVAMFKAAPGFLENFDRLTGSTFTVQAPIAQVIDIASGKREADEKALRHFIVTEILSRLKKDQP